MMRESKVELGRSGVMVAPLGTGTWSWGDTLYWGFGKGYGEAEIHAAFEASLRAGITFFDTAEVYGFGKSEKFIAKFSRGHDKSQIQVATKFFPLPWRLTPAQIVSALRGSLKRLELERVDLYQIHWSTPLFSIERMMDGLAAAVEKGMTRAVGVSNFNAEQMRRAYARLAKYNIPLASNQIQFSLLERSPDFNGLVETCRELGVTLIAYSPLKYGMLTGKYTPDNPPRGARAALSRGVPRANPTADCHAAPNRRKIWRQITSASGIELGHAARCAPDSRREKCQTAGGERGCLGLGVVGGRCRVVESSERTRVEQPLASMTADYDFFLTEFVQRVDTMSWSHVFLGGMNVWK